MVVCINLNPLLRATNSQFARLERIQIRQDVKMVFMAISAFGVALAASERMANLSNFPGR